MMKQTLLIAALLSVFAVSYSQLRLPAVIGSNMVLQQRSQVALWGWGNPGDKVFVTISWSGKTDTVIVDRDAKWKLMTKTPGAGGPYTITFKSGNTITAENVMIGEVWICSGQSNMEFNTYFPGSKDMKPELKNAPNNNIHLFLVPKTTAKYPQEDCRAKWTVCDSNALKAFSEPAYFFGKKLQAALNVPIGLIEAAWGGTPAEVWTPAELIQNDDTLQEAAHRQVAYEKWPFWPGYTYNAMIAPLTAYNLAGAIWYQGEANTSAPASYGRLLTTMIKAWRAAWSKDLPFYYVQIAPFVYGARYQGSIIQEQQAKIALANTGMVVTTDLTPDTTDIHPNEKKAVGERLAAWALAKTYLKTGIDYASPTYKNMTVENGKAVITFENAEGGLITKGNAANALYIAGDDKTFYPAQSKIAGSKLLVWSDHVQHPSAVRFTFSNAAVGNLFAKNGLPVAPFRTDDWLLNPDLGR